MGGGTPPARRRRRLRLRPLTAAQPARGRATGRRPSGALLGARSQQLEGVQPGHRGHRRFPRRGRDAITVHPDPFGPGSHPNALQLHESEAAFQAVVDPYARADFFISFGEEGVNVEEGFITLTSLPGGLLTKVGKMRAAFGKVNSLHNHVLPWADRPLVIGNLVGGEDGIDDAGISVARLIPNPWIFLEATGQVFRGDSGADPDGNAAVSDDAPQRAELRRPPARLPGHHRQREHRSRRLVLARPQRR